MSWFNNDFVYELVLPNMGMTCITQFISMFYSYIALTIVLSVINKK